MIAKVVVDVGNTHIKWGLCSDRAVTRMEILPGNDRETWHLVHQQWQLAPGATWVITGVQPARQRMLADWVRSRGDRVIEITHASQLPLHINLVHPEKVGMDRLFDAVAANARRDPKVPAMIIDAGSAVTVDAVDASGAFLGGAILPGMRLMSEALHEYTALLPRVKVPQFPPDWPGTSTESAIAAGVYWAVVGGARILLDRWSASLAEKPCVFLTGGDGPSLATAFPDAQPWPTMTLEGIRLAAEKIE